MGIRSRLLAQAYRQALAQVDVSGCIGVQVQPKPVKQSFYEEQGFVNLELVDTDSPLMLLLLPISDIRDAFGE